MTRQAAKSALRSNEQATNMFSIPIDGSQCGNCIHWWSSFASNNSQADECLKRRLTSQYQYDILYHVNDGLLAQWQSKRLLKCAQRGTLPFTAECSLTKAK